jgi:hypothetical protein
MNRAWNRFYWRARNLWASWPRWAKPAAWVDAMRDWIRRAFAPATSVAAHRDALADALSDGRPIVAVELIACGDVRVSHVVEQAAAPDLAVALDPSIQDTLHALRAASTTSAAKIVAEFGRDCRSAGIHVSAALAGFRRPAGGVIPAVRLASDGSDDPYRPWELMMLHVQPPRLVVGSETSEPEAQDA